MKMTVEELLPVSFGPEDLTKKKVSYIPNNNWASLLVQKHTSVRDTQRTSSTCWSCIDVM